MKTLKSIQENIEEEYEIENTKIKNEKENKEFKEKENSSDEET